MGEQYSRYTIDLKIDIEKQLLESDTRLSYLCRLPSTEDLYFYIHKDMEVEEIISDRKVSYEVGSKIAEWSPFVLESKQLKLTFDEPILKDERVDIRFKYKGQIDTVTKYEVNRLTKEWIELGIYTPWFPLHESMEQVLFDVRVYVDSEYKVINAKQQGDVFIINQPIPQNDCTIVASDKFKRLQDVLEGFNLNVYFLDHKHETIAQQIRDYSKNVLNRYRKFGRIELQDISIVIVPRKEGGGYCRPGLIVVTPSDDVVSEINYFKYIAHELAHLWWYRAKTDSWEDWLNESLAEYCALTAIRDIYGEEEFDNKLDRYQKATEGMPPIKDLNRGHDKAFQVLYMKGPLLLNELEKKIGREKFEELLIKAYASNANTTEKFLGKLSELTNPVVRESFSMLLEE